MSALHNYIDEQTDIEGLRKLLTSGENLNSFDNLNRTPLHIAVLRCERNPELINEILLVVRELVCFGANVDKAVDVTPLHLAVVSRDCKITEALLEANADINKQDKRGWAALHYATSKSHAPEIGVVKLLLRYNPKIDIQTKMKVTPLMLAVQYNDLDIIIELLKKEPLVKLQDNYGETVMHHALRQPVVNMQVVLKLTRRGCSFNTDNLYHKTPRDNFIVSLDYIQTKAERNKAMQLMKLFILEGYQFSKFEMADIHRFHLRNKKLKLSQFLDECHKEIENMRAEALSPNCTIYDIAFRGAFKRNNGIDARFTVEVFDAVLNKLVRHRFINYSDVILSGMSSSYINDKFAEICCNVVSGIEMFEFDLLSLLSKYLKKVEKLNMIIACLHDIAPYALLMLFILFMFRYIS